MDGVGQPRPPDGAAHPAGGRPDRMEGAAERRRFPLPEIAHAAHAQDHAAGALLHPLSRRPPQISREVYPDLDAFWSDLVEAYHREMQSLAEAGCSYLQIDETSLIKLGDPRVRDLLAERGDDWRDLLRLYIRVVNAVVAGAPDGMTIGVHVCRSQDPSWQADVGYDAVARPLFNDMNVGIYFLEYDNPRAGTLIPLRTVPPGNPWCSAWSPPRWRSSRPPTISSAASRMPAAISPSSNCA